MPYCCSAISHMKVTDFIAIFRLIEAQEKRVELGELHNWSLADVLSDIEAMPLAQGSRSKILAAIKEKAIDGKILCGFEVCTCGVNALL
jgi:hypothetical protein